MPCGCAVYRFHNQCSYRLHIYSNIAAGKVIVFIIFFLVLQRIEGDILYPRIVGKSVGLPELWLLVAAMIGAGLGGIMGMIISVPLCSVFYALFSDYIKRRLQAKKMNDI